MLEASLPLVALGQEVTGHPILGYGLKAGWFGWRRLLCPAWLVYDRKMRPRILSAAEWPGARMPSAR